MSSTRVSRGIWLVILATALTLPRAAWAQEPEFFYMFFKESRPLTIDVFQIAAFNPATAPVLGRGLEEFPTEPLTSQWTLADVSSSPSSGGGASIVDFIDELATELGKAAGLCAPLAGPIFDELFPFQWNLQQASDIDIQGPEGLALCAGVLSVIVAVLDDGVDPFHPQLPDQLTGADFTFDCDDPSGVCAGAQPRNACSRHGTAVSGVIKSTADVVGTVGVAPNVTILPVRTGTYTDSSSPGSETGCRTALLSLLLMQPESRLRFSLAGRTWHLEMSK